MQSLIIGLMKIKIEFLLILELTSSTKYETFVMGWSDKNGIYGLFDEDREFDEKFQEGEE